MGGACGGRVGQAGQKTGQDAAVLLGRAQAAGALADLGQVGGDHAIPAGAGRGGEVGGRGWDEGLEHWAGAYH